MKITLYVHTTPRSTDSEDDMSHLLTDGGIQMELESAIEQYLQRAMGWRDITVNVEIMELLNDA